MTTPLVEGLVSSGMSPDAARARQPLFRLAREALLARNVARRAVTGWFVPGRIEVLGKHTDYAGGRSLLCAVERGVCVVAAPRDDGVVRVMDAVVREEVEFPFAPDIEPPRGHWSNYPMTVVRRVARNFPRARKGLDIAVASDLPLGAGISSSSAFVVAIFLAVSHVNDLPGDEAYRREIATCEDLASYLGCVENGQHFGSLAGDRGAGIFGGSEDQTAILCGAANMLSQYSFCPVRAEGRVALPRELTFVVAHSGVVAEKAGAARELYNRASAATRVIVELWNEHEGRRDGSLGAAVDSAPGAADRIREVLQAARVADYSPGMLVNRFEQFVAESTRIIPAARAALELHDLPRFGALVDESQHNVERWLGNQVPQTVTLQREARALGAVAASAFGAGFGGSVWALVERAGAAEFARRWASRYRMAFPEAGKAMEVFLTGAGPAAQQVDHV
ncbi:MAG TPA: galactokinase family protein [Gemmatimonadaceae bacterium]|nr:galactokinase family protein [Gemmatimonadaceae bacterium]